MDVKIEIKTGGYPMPEHASVDEVLAARISEQERILNALEVKKSKVVEKKAMLESIAKEATRIREQAEKMAIQLGAVEPVEYKSIPSNFDA